MKKEFGAQKWVKIAKSMGFVGLTTLRYLWLSVWTLYQIALGAILILLIWGFFRVSEYMALGEIRDLRHENPKTTTFMEAQKERLKDSLRVKGVYPVPDSLIRWSWIPYDSIPTTILDIVLVAEDAKFFEHQGFDLEQIEFAVVANHQMGKPARGASTITQQVAKNLFLSRDKELSRKVREALLTLELESFLSKERILEIYLNIAQFDENIFGIKEASRHYLKKEPQQLTQEEAINLICLLPAPTKWDMKRPNNAYLQHKRLVFRNYVLYKGLRLDVDTNQVYWQDTVFSNLATQLSEERWKQLRSRPGFEASGNENLDGNQDSNQTPGEQPQNQNQIQDQGQGGAQTF